MSTMKVPMLEELNGDVQDIPLGRFERGVIRTALGLYADQVEKAAKKDAELGVGSDRHAIVLAAVNGSDGWGQGLLDKMLGQQSIEDEAKRVERERRKRAAAVRDMIAAACVGEDGAPLNTLALDRVLAWSDDERGEAEGWASAVVAARDDASVVVPACPWQVVEAIEAEAKAREAVAERVAEWVGPKVLPTTYLCWTPEQVEEAAKWATQYGEAWGTDRKLPDVPEFIRGAVDQAREALDAPIEAAAAAAGGVGIAEGEPVGAGAEG